MGSNDGPHHSTQVGDPLSRSHERDVHFHALWDLTDATNLCIRIMQETSRRDLQPCGQSHVQVSFESAEYTANSDALGNPETLARPSGYQLEKKTRFLSGLHSELYGKAQEIPQSENHALLSQSLMRRQSFNGY